MKKSVKTGQFFLYEYLESRDNKTVLHYPRIAIYLNSRVLDMALEIDFYKQILD